MHEPPRRPAEPVLDEDAQPATVGELRSVRRWLLVAGVWAVAATAIAVIALIAANQEEDTGNDNAATPAQVERVQRDLSEQIDDLEGRLDELPQGEDVARLDDRLKKVESDTGKTSDQITDLSNQLGELEGRVEALEESAAAPEPTETTP
jgi:TolA-binding protein